MELPHILIGNSQTLPPMEPITLSMENPSVCKWPAEPRGQPLRGSQQAFKRRVLVASHHTYLH
jgi:hypothetical protein